MIKASDLIAKFQYALDEKWGYIWGAAGLIWTEARQKAATREQTIQYGSRWIGRHVADCSGLFSWAFKELGGYMYHGSNTMYNKYCTAKGAMSKGMQLRPGTAVFCGDTANKSHVGLYIGDGWVIEAAGTREGVIRSKVTLKKWTYWGKLKGVEYDQGGGTMPAADTRPTLKKGSKGEYVTLLQTMLINRGYSCGAYGADGDFGNATDLAVRRFQEAHNLTVDGIVGPKTWAALDNAQETASVTYTVTITGISKDQVTKLLKEYPEADVTEERG